MFRKKLPLLKSIEEMNSSDVERHLEVIRYYFGRIPKSYSLEELGDFALDYEREEGLRINLGRDTFRREVKAKKDPDMSKRQLSFVYSGAGSQLFSLWQELRILLAKDYGFQFDPKERYKVSPGSDIRELMRPEIEAKAEIDEIFEIAKEAQLHRSVISQMNDIMKGKDFKEEHGRKATFQDKLSAIKKIQAVADLLAANNKKSDSKQDLRIMIDMIIPKMQHSEKLLRKCSGIYAKPDITDELKLTGVKHEIFKHITHVLVKAMQGQVHRDYKSIKDPVRRLSAQFIDEQYAYLKDVSAKQREKTAVDIVSSNEFVKPGRRRSADYLKSGVHTRDAVLSALDNLIKEHKKHAPKMARTEPITYVAVYLDRLEQYLNDELVKIERGLAHFSAGAKIAPMLLEQARYEDVTALKEDKAACKYYLKLIHNKRMSPEERLQAICLFAKKDENIDGLGRANLHSPIRTINPLQKYEDSTFRKQIEVDNLKKYLEALAKYLDIELAQIKGKMDEVGYRSARFHDRIPPKLTKERDEIGSYQYIMRKFSHDPWAVLHKLQAYASSHQTNSKVQAAVSSIDTAKKFDQSLLRRGVAIAEQEARVQRRKSHK